MGPFLFPVVSNATSMLKSVASAFLVDWYVTIYTSVYGTDVVYADIVKQFNGYLKQMINDNPVASTFTNMIVAIGLVIMLYYFFSDLSAKATANQLSTLQVGKSFCAALFSVFVIFNSKQIFIFMMNFVEGINSSLNDFDSNSRIVSEVLGSEVVQVLLSRCVTNNFSIGSIVGYTLAALLLFLASLATKIYIMYYALTRIIQLFIYYVFAPIGVADIFENDIGGTINVHSSGFRYLKTMFAIMLQLVVITVVCQAFPFISTATNTGYFIDQGETEYDTGNFAEVVQKNNEAVLYPLKKFEYTDHKANILEIAWNKASNIKNALKAVGAIASGKDVEIDTDNKKEKLKDSEKHKLVGNDGIFDGKRYKVQDEDMIKKILKNKKYRMTIESTERFFGWCIGADGGKMVLFIILYVTKILMIHSSAKMCNYIVGTNV